MNIKEQDMVMRVVGAGAKRQVFKGYVKVLFEGTDGNSYAEVITEDGKRINALLSDLDLIQSYEEHEQEIKDVRRTFDDVEESEQSVQATEDVDFIVDPASIMLNGSSVGMVRKESSEHGVQVDLQDDSPTAPDGFTEEMNVAKYIDVTNFSLHALIQNAQVMLGHLEELRQAYEFEDEPSKHIE